VCQFPSSVRIRKWGGGVNTNSAPLEKANFPISAYDLNVRRIDRRLYQGPKVNGVPLLAFKITFIPLLGSDCKLLGKIYA